jgi:colanic acid/amylovoran biosynthesis glycosyltransferase
MEPRHTGALAYLIGHYPAVTHTFILREVTQLREMGLEIETVSINPPEWSQDGVTDAERREAARTFYVKARGGPRILCDLAACLISRPLRFLSGLLLALRLAEFDLSAALRYFLYFLEAVVVGRWMRRNRLQHLHVHFAIATSIVAMIVKKVYGTPYSITVHGPNEFYDVTRERLRQKIEGASFLCCISSFCRSQLMSVAPPRHWEKLEVCPLGVDPAVFQPRHTATGKFQIVCVGRLMARKGQAVLLAATAKLLERGQRVHLSLIGDGPDRQALEIEAARLNIRGDVTFHGWINQGRIREFLEQADVFVLPSFAEGVPVSLMEAMAMEIPCISTFIAGIPELIHSGENGILTPASDAGMLAAAIETLIDDPALRIRLARAGRRTVVESYDLRSNTERLAALFRRRLGSGEPRSRDQRAVAGAR